MTQPKLVAAAGYIRMSTDKQEDSPARQRREIEKMAARGDFLIVEWYEDHGQTGTASKNRAGFQRLLEDAKKGDFRAVLVHEHSRFSREDIFEAFAHFKLLKDYGVRLITSARGELKMDDLAGMLMMLVDQHGAHDESLKIAARTLSGKVTKSERGQRTGRAPFGFDREIHDEKGKVVSRIPYGTRFQIPKGWRSVLVPAADTAQTDAIRYIFESFVAGATLNSIAAEVNRRGHRTFGSMWKKPRAAGRSQTKNNYFNITDLKRILANPVYCGTFRFGFNPQGKFSRVENEIAIEDNHPAIVSKKLFREAQFRLEASRRVKATVEPGRYLLSGMIACEHCGKKIYGQRFRAWGMQKHYEMYRCTQGPHGIEDCEVHPYVYIAPMEEMVLTVIKEQILNERIWKELVAVALELSHREEPGLEDDQISALERNIAKATENLALADRENIPGIQKTISGWRSQIKDLRSRLERRSKRKRSDENVPLLKSLKEFRDRIHLADRTLLSAMLKTFISHITLGSRIVEDGPFQHREIFGRIHFFGDVTPECYSFEQPLRELGNVRVGRYVAQKGEPVTMQELCEVFDLGYRTIQYHVQRALEAKQIVRLRNRPGNTHFYVAPGV